MDWSPFVVCDPAGRAPGPRGLNGPDGIGDRLRTAAFAERQATEAFLWAAAKFREAPPELREAWRRIGEQEREHMNLLLSRMKELGGDVAARPVSDRLWRSLSACADYREFAGLMREAERRGQAAEESFEKSLRESDPVTAEIFRKIAADEAEHLAVADRFLPTPP